MRVSRGLAAGLLLAFVALSTSASEALAADPTFGEPSATATLGQPLTFTSHIDGVEGGVVEVLVGLAGEEPRVVVPATSGTLAGDWQVSREIDVAASSDCMCSFEGQSPPNTKIEYQFRVRAADGTETLGPVGQITVQDERFEWRTIEQDLVRVHWYEGDEAFAQAAAAVANEAIDHAAELMGSTLPEPVDLFVYATQDALLDAVAPNRENIAGQAHSGIGTMFVWLELDPFGGVSERSRVIVAHELTHLVFNEATENLYHAPPRWLNEGIAVYLSEGYGAGDQVAVAQAAQSGTLIPLDGLAGFFPSPQDQFYLAYSESVSAVDFFIRTYGEQTLWDLVRSYAAGQSDNDAFTTATGADVAAFNAAWMASLSVEVPAPVGPQPAPPGPVPSAWNVTAPETSAPGSPQPTEGPPGTALQRLTPAPPRTATPGNPAPANPGSGGSDAVMTGLAIGVLVLAAVVTLVLLIQYGRPRPAPPPPSPPPTSPPSPPPPVPPATPPPQAPSY